MEQKQYERNEIHRMYTEQERVNKAPLIERQEARESFHTDMRDFPELVAERISWLFNGSYGYAEQQKAIEIAKNIHMNRVAALSQLIAIEEWMCPANFAVDAWKRLTQEQRTKVDTLIQAEIDEYLTTEAIESFTVA